METGNYNNIPREPYILFEISGTTYGIHSRYVQQMEMIENITPVPNTAPYIDGVMYSRGQAIPVINLRAMFGLERIGYNMSTRVIVIRHMNRTVGLIADVAKEYGRLATEMIQPAPDFISGYHASWLEGIYRQDQRVILIFNVNELMKTEEKKVEHN